MLASLVIQQHSKRCIKRKCSTQVMGCTASSRMGNQDEVWEGVETLGAYARLERAIYRAELEVPGAALSHAAARAEALRAAVQAAGRRASASADGSLREVLLELQLFGRPQAAAEHEEFVANLNRSALAHHEVAAIVKKQQKAEEDMQAASEKANQLQGLYQQLDTLLSKVFGEEYGSVDEQTMEMALDKLRSYRDTLAAGRLEWLEADKLVREAADLLEVSLDKWRSLQSASEEGERLTLATEARDAIHEASLCVQLAQTLLPGVQFPCCTPREITTVLQGLVYLFTDIYIPERYTHAGRCYTNFYERSLQLAHWIEQTIEGTLTKDFDDAEKQVNDAATRLRVERLKLIKGKLGSGVDVLPTNAIVETLEAGAPHQQNNLLPGANRMRLQHSALFRGQSPGTGRQIYVPPPQKEYQEKLEAHKAQLPGKHMEPMQMDYWRAPNH